LKPWFEELPDRFQVELDALKRSGYTYSINESKRVQGILELTVAYLLDGNAHELTVHYPDCYPYLPMTITSRTLPPGRHICANSGVLCLMENPQSSWGVNDTLTGILDDQVKKIIHAHRHPESALEAADGHQRSGQYPYAPESVLLTSDWSIPKEHDRGELLIGLEQKWSQETPIRGAVLEVRDSKGNVLAKLDQRIAARYSIKIKGRWIRTSEPPQATPNGKGPLPEAVQMAPSLNRFKPDGGVDVIGILFPEESSRDVVVENWLFLIRYEVKGKKKDLVYTLSRTDCLDKENMLARVASLHPLADKKVMLVGAGAIGSTIAWQLARAGIGTLKIIDQDFVQVGNMPRWQLGLPFVGRSKALALQEYLSTAYPYTQVEAFAYQIGSPRTDTSSLGDIQVLELALQEVDLVVDATAELGVSNLLSDLCRKKGIAFVWAEGRPGSRGGVVGRVVPDHSEGCWMCYRHHQYGGSIDLPVQEETPDIQPKGCFHPTFTGTGFDMDEVSIAATRLVASTLCHETRNAYPKLDWNVGIVNLWDHEGNPTPPTWKTYPLSIHPNCPKHG